MLEKIGQFRWEKCVVLFLYMCAQVLVLAALLTMTSMVVHIIFLLLAALFYFITSIKQPGTYEGIVEPNLEDAEMSCSKVEKSKTTRSVQMKVQQNNQVSKIQAAEIGSKKQKQPEKGKEDLRSSSKGEADSKKRTSMEQIIKEAGPKIEKNKIEAGQKNSLPIEGKKSTLEGGKFNFLEAAKNMFGSLNVFKSKKQTKEVELEKHEEKEESEEKDQQNDSKSEKSKEKVQSKEEDKGDNKNQNKNQEKSQAAAPPINPIEENNVSSVLREKRSNSAIGKEDFAKSQIESQFAAPDHIKERLVIPQRNIVAKRIQKMKRYCRICQTYQSLRVRHCYSCDKCIATFDHHCPWMANCIGQKNKFFFILYLFFQTLQLFTITVDLIRYLAHGDSSNTGSVGILLIAIFLFFVLLSCLLAFHLYLTAINLTTWQFLRWNKIEYLTIFDKSKVSSPFNKGIKNNFKMLWDLMRSQQQKKWLDQISDDLSKFVLRKPKGAKSQYRAMQSDRKPFRSEKAVI